MFKSPHTQGGITTRFNFSFKDVKIQKVKIVTYTLLTLNQRNHLAKYLDTYCSLNHC